MTDIEDETVVELVRKYPDRIVAIKDASGDLDRVTAHRLNCADDFVLLSGVDELSLGFNAAGGVGCISVTANVAPRMCADFHAAAAQGDFATAREINERLYPLHKAMFADASPSPAKYALSKLFDWFSPEVRLPIVDCSDAAKAAVDKAMEGAGVTP